MLKIIPILHEITMHKFSQLKYLTIFEINLTVPFHSIMFNYKNYKQKTLKNYKESISYCVRTIHFTGHFTFYNNKNIINIDDIIANIILD